MQFSGVEKRKIRKNPDGSYESLKPSFIKEGQEEWERKGRQYDIRGLCSLFEQKNIEFYIPEEILTEIGRYKREQLEKHRNYAISKQGLEDKAQSKTI